MASHLEDHPEYIEGCFGCKIQTISISNLQVKAFAHKNESELTAYSEARKQGIQPASTKMKDINKAVRVSDATGIAAKAV